jgi:solute carrier family 44 (choline transporter-like protein), member 2/4/5
MYNFSNSSMSGLNSMTLAGSFGAWYWTRFKNISKEYENKLPLFTLFGSFGRAIFFHFGTIAFGSLLIAIVKFIRLVLEFFMNRVKSKTDSSRIAKFLLCCCKCCFMCLEKFLKFLNRYAFIITAVYSLNFCRAAGKAFKLITTNVLRIVVVDKISGFVLLLSNLAITAGIGVLSFYFFSNKIPIDGISKYSPDLNYYILPVIVIVIGTFVVTKVFFDVFAMGIDSILICVLIDLDENDGSKGKPYFMSKNLRRILKINNKRD